MSFEQIKGTLQRKAYDDAGLPLPTTKPQGNQLQQLLQVTAFAISSLVETFVQ